MLCALPENGRLLDAVQALRNMGELLHDLRQLRLVVLRRPMPVKFLKGRFHALADGGHFPREVAGESVHRPP
ncbi:Uncharacterised protein [Mycobacterium tuberculosis]|nr:Uncharacterised protein [Mycobacterium tuberculosis]